MTRRTLIPACLLLAIVAGGCGSTSTGSDSPARSTATTPAAKTTVNPGVSDAERAIGRFARTFINWRMATLSDTKRKLAAMASGELRAQLTTEATQAANDEALSETTAENTGTVEAITVRKDKPVLVVTHETAKLGDGRAAQSGYFVYLASAKRTSTGWTITGFQPATS